MGCVIFCGTPQVFHIIISCVPLPKLSEHMAFMYISYTFIIIKSVDRVAKNQTYLEELLPVSIVGWFDCLRLNVPINKFSVILDGFLGLARI